MRSDTCSNCRFADPDARNQLYCRAKPPNGQAIPIPGPEGIQFSTVAVFPPVQPQQWCGHWTPTIVVPSRYS